MSGMLDARKFVIVDLYSKCLTLQSVKKEINFGNYTENEDLSILKNYNQLHGAGRS